MKASILLFLITSIFTLNGCGVFVNYANLQQTAPWFTQQNGINGECHELNGNYSTLAELIVYVAGKPFLLAPDMQGMGGKILVDYGYIGPLSIYEEIRELPYDLSLAKYDHFIDSSSSKVSTKEEREKRRQIRQQEILKQEEFSKKSYYKLSQNGPILTFELIYDGLPYRRIKFNLEQAYVYCNANGELIIRQIFDGDAPEGFAPKYIHSLETHIRKNNDETLEIVRYKLNWDGDISSAKWKKEVTLHEQIK